ARALLRQGLQQAGRPVAVHDEPSHGAAIDTMLDGIQPGDFVLLQPEVVDSRGTIDRVRRWIQP
ncbi:hypothetical protein, partial [Bordetella petrii]|uniref:hypothetical protein n=1 Tax=Bordetella petrii TaxID=94624 RepID=UPI001E387FDC